VPASVEVYRGDLADKTVSESFPADGRTWSYTEEMRHFARCVRTGEAFRSPAADAMHDVRALEEVYKAHVHAG
jgi:predicted dehydrogenase